MEKLVLIFTSFLLMSSVLGQEKQSKPIQNQSLNKNVESTQVKEVATEQKSTINTHSNSNQPISYTVGSDGMQRVVRDKKTLDDFTAQTIEEVKRQLKELYGDYYAEYGEPNIAFNADFYERCEFISLASAPNNIPNISSLDVKNKYNPEKIYHDNIAEFNKGNFNFLKYSFDYYIETVQYYKIYNTNMVLKIKGLN